MDLSDSQVEQLTTEIRDYQITHGSLLKLVRFEEETTVPARPVSVSLYPTAFPGQLFEDALALQQSFNELYIRASNDPSWLEGVLQNLLKFDDLVHGLWHVFKRVPRNTQNIVCGIFRSDYMVHNDTSSLKQVEMNTFSVAGGCHAERVASMHRHVQHVLGTEPKRTLPENHNTSTIVDILALAHQHYKPSTQKKVCILMIVQGVNFNIADERPIEYGMVERGIPCYRCDWNDVLAQTSVDSDLSLLYAHPWSGEQHEIGVVVSGNLRHSLFNTRSLISPKSPLYTKCNDSLMYQQYYRAGYEATDYKGDGAAVRLHLERSRAIKCPDVLTHLMTLKIVQAALTAPGAVERFLSSEEATRIRETFMPMQSLDSSPSGLMARQYAIDQEVAKDYVLKPNLEGGGHNIYQEAIPEFLASISKDQWSNYSIMRLIESPEAHGLLETPAQRYQGPVVSELGVLGACLWRRNGNDVEIISNKQAGWTFKTKPAGMMEMNVVKGNGCFDCPLLTS